MKTLLKDLTSGDEFTYVDDAKHYRKGRFLVLNSDGNYLVASGVVGSRFLYSYATNKVVSHYVELEIIKKEINVKSQNQMGHFVGWKFGVSVKVSTQSPISRKGAFTNAKLVYEDATHFVVIGENGVPAVCGKLDHYYELIPYIYSNVMSPRYPVCSGLNSTAFCNAWNKMASMDVTFRAFKEYPTAKLTLEDGTEIILSDETTEALRQQFGR